MTLSSVIFVGVMLFAFGFAVGNARQLEAGKIIVLMIVLAMLISEFAKNDSYTAVMMIGFVAGSCCRTYPIWAVLVNALVKLSIKCVIAMRMTTSSARKKRLRLCGKSCLGKGGDRMQRKHVNADNAKGLRAKLGVSRPNKGKSKEKAEKSDQAINRVGSELVVTLGWKRPKSRGKSVLTRSSQPKTQVVSSSNANEVSRARIIIAAKTTGSAKANHVLNLIVALKPAAKNLPASEQDT